jgi:hypothetical protein
MSHDIATLRLLKERVEKATGEDREIDYSLFDLFGEDRKGPIFWQDSAPPYTDSLDACVSLAERVLPGWIWSVKNGSPNLGEPPYAYIACDTPEDKTGRASAATPALAFLSAILAALIAQEEGR